MLGGVLALVLRGLEAMGWHRALRFSDALARWGARRMPKRAAIARSNIRRALPHLSQARRAAIAAQSWPMLLRIGVFLALLLRLTRPRDAHRLRMRVEARALRALAQRGCLILSGHMGPMELTNLALASFDISATALIAEAHNKGARETLAARRRLIGSNHTAIARGTRAATRALARAQRDGATIILYPDQHMPGGTRAKFLGLPARVGGGAAWLARRMPTILAQPYWRADDSTGFALSLVAMPANPTAQDPLTLIEHNLRARPSQWLWAHRFWKFGSEQDWLAKTR